MTRSTMGAGEVAFPVGRSGLHRLGGLGAVLVVTGTAMLLVPVELLGVPVQWAVAALFGVLAAVLGVWFVLVAVRRLRSPRPGVEVADDGLVLYLGTREPIGLGREEVLGIDGPAGLSGIQRSILGGAVVAVRTTRPEGVMSSDVRIGAAFVDAPLDEVAEHLRRWFDG